MSSPGDDSSPRAKRACTTRAVVNIPDGSVLIHFSVAPRDFVNADHELYPFCIAVPPVEDGAKATELQALAQKAVAEDWTGEPKCVADCACGENTQLLFDRIMVQYAAHNLKEAFPNNPAVVVGTKLDALTPVDLHVMPPKPKNLDHLVFLFHEVEAAEAIARTTKEKTIAGAL